MSEYKYGDKVIMVSDKHFCVPKGTTGTIRGDENTKHPYIVWEYPTKYKFTDRYGKEWENMACAEKGKDFVPMYRKLVVSFNGDVTTASLVVNGEVYQTASVVRYKDDEYDAAIGAKEAIDKLFKAYTGYAINDGDIKQFINGKCLDTKYDATWTPIKIEPHYYYREGFTGWAIYNGSNTSFTKGEAYEIVNGRVSDNNKNGHNYNKADWLEVNDDSEYFFLPF